MTVFITRISLLFLFTCQINEARLIENAEIDIQRNSLTRLNGVSEKLSRKPRNPEGWSKRIPWKCKYGNTCNGEPNVSTDYPKLCSGSVNCENNIQTKSLNRGRKVMKERFKMDVASSTPLSGFKRILENLARKSPCPAENPRCERKRTDLTTRKITYLCPTDFKCLKKRKNPRTAKIVCQPGFNCGNGELRNDDSSMKSLQEYKLDEGKKHCPIGLWCSPKRELNFETSDTLKDCPPGLWCKRNGIQMREGSFTKRVETNRERYKCPTGLWCAVKREEGYESFETLSQCPPGLWCKRDKTKIEDDQSMSQETDIAKFKECPTGLWCSAKRGEGFENSETLQQCPPGLWCKKNNILSEDDNTELNNIAERCPTGLWCSIKRKRGYQDSETLRQCPPGLWCKRSVLRDSNNLMEQKNAIRLDCPTGLWCALKRELANIGVSEDCPPGLWCKRNGVKTKDPLIEERITAPKARGVH